MTWLRKPSSWVSSLLRRHRAKISADGELTCPQQYGLQLHKKSRNVDFRKRRNDSWKSNCDPEATCPQADPLSPLSMRINLRPGEETIKSRVDARQLEHTLSRCGGQGTHLHPLHPNYVIRLELGGGA
ncbi:unnamed protein product [Mesocestoides corti]|uniref:Uncharacterized protein n=1 Tax=Mesocestoides corti TaxID=53468 RepID=A0A0R3U3W5_MESCO|nr:unnamed protein product [Mesocestoides corti]